MHFAHRVQILQALQRLAAHVRDLLLAQRPGHLVDVLQAAAAAILHADPQFVAPQIRAKVRDDVRMAAVAHHDDLLLDHLDVVARLDFDHFDGGQLVALDAFRLRGKKNNNTTQIHGVTITILDSRLYRRQWLIQICNKPLQITDKLRAILSH